MWGAEAMERKKEIPLTQRVRALSSESAFSVLAAANRLEAQGRKIVHFEIGEPKFPTPRNIVERAEQALEEGYTTYCNAQGLPALREAIAEQAKSRQIDAKPEEIVVTPGGKPIIYYTVAALVGPGDEVICPDPGFPVYASVVRYAGGVPVPIRLREKNRFRLDVEELKRSITPRTRLLILNSPSNPTGSLLTGRDLEAIAGALTGTDIFVLSDEIYNRIVYGGEAPSIAALPGMKERTVVLDGFSKTYAMTGWRLGYGIMPAPLAEAVTRHVVNSVSCTTHFVQVAGVEALKGPQDSVREMVKEFRRRRDVIVEGLNAIPGVTCLPPDGAFYAFPNIRGTGIGSAEAARRLLEEAGVAVLDGASFGAGGDGYLRLSYAASMEDIREGLSRMDAFFRCLRRNSGRKTATSI